MLAIMKSLPCPNMVPCRCGHTGCGCGMTRPGWFDDDSELGTHNLRFVLDEPARPVRLDMDGSWVPMGMHPAPRKTSQMGSCPPKATTAMRTPSIRRAPLTI